MQQHVWLMDDHEGRARFEIQQALHMLEDGQKKATWFFIAEGGRAVPEEKPVAEYWDRYPPFRAKGEADSVLRVCALAGAKGFIYNGPSSNAKSKYRDSYRWLGELESEISRLMVETTTPARRKRTSSSAIIDKNSE